MRLARTEAEAAYFQLLRAREALEQLRRYGEYLERERVRLQRFVAEGDALDAHVDARLRRPLVDTDRRLGEVLRARHRIIDEELAALPERLAAAEAFVADCEREYERLRRPR